MPKRKTHEEFISEVYNLVGAEYTVLGTYSNNKIHILMRHNNCKDGSIFEWRIRPDAFVNKGRRCEKCGGTKKLTNEEFVNRLNEKHGDNLTALETYINLKTNILMECNICFHQWRVKPGHLLHSGSGCPICANNRNAERLYLTNEDFLNRLEKVHGVDYTPLEPYKSMKLDKILVRHNVCGYEWSVLPDSLLRGQGCFKCYGTPKRSFEDYVSDLKGVHGDEYIILSEYKNALEKVTAKHAVCSYVWEVQANSLLNGSGCPNCSKSKGENRIRDCLNKFGLNYKREVTIDGCVYHGKLKFDFAIVDRKNVINCLIEYQGVQHYEPIEFFGGVDALRGTQIRDKIKYEYCKENNIKLIIIPYWELENIERLLEEAIKSLSKNI